MFSDNLRNQMITRYQFYGEDMPAVVNWVVSHPAAYRARRTQRDQPVTADCGNVLRPTSCTPLGVFFVLEPLGLAFVMGLWNFRWLPLYAVFVDWDWLAERLKLTPARETVELRSPRFRKAFPVFAVLFLTYYCLVAFALLPKSDVELKTYPFTAFTVYYDIAAKPPFNRHQPQANRHKN